METSALIRALAPSVSDFMDDMENKHRKMLLDLSSPNIKAVVLILNNGRDEDEDVETRPSLDEAILASTRARNGYRPQPKNPFNI
jgi:hypothetical protein